jgi:hypothetical protein
MFYWKNNVRLSWIIIILFFLTGCITGKQESDFYPIDSLVILQHTQLRDMKAMLHKTASLQGKLDSVSYVPDSASWGKELDIFIQLQEINKPVNHGSYLVDDNLLDPSSNLTVKAFTATEPELSVKYMKIFYQHSIDKPRRIEALFDEKNELYESSRLLSMEFRQINNKTVLTSYSIDGGQTMIMGDSVAFLIKGQILID